MVDLWGLEKGRSMNRDVSYVVDDTSFIFTMTVG